MKVLQLRLLNSIFAELLIIYLMQVAGRVCIFRVYKINTVASISEIDTYTVASYALP